MTLMEGPKATTRWDIIIGPPSFNWQYAVYLHKNFKQRNWGNAESASLNYLFD